MSMFSATMMVMNTSAPMRCLKNFGVGLAVGGFFLYALFGIASGFHLGAPDSQDFQSFVASGRAVVAGANPYDHLAMDAVVTRPNLDPPTLLPLFSLLGAIPIKVAHVAWTLVSLACYVAAVVLVWRYGSGAAGGRRLVWAFALAGFWFELGLGQIYMPLLLVAVVAWLLLARKHPLVGGILIGIVCAVKPQFLFWPAMLMLGGLPVAAIAAGAAFLGFSLLPVAIYGPSIYLEWGRLILNNGPPPDIAVNASLVAVGTRLGAPLFGWVAALALAVVLGVLVLKRHHDASAFGIIGALLISPISWLAYSIFLLPVVLKRRWSRLMAVGCLGLLVPPPVVFWTPLLPRPLFVLAGSLYCWALLAVCFALIRDAELPVTFDEVKV